MMHGVIREVCALSVFCGLAMSIMPEGSVKRVAGVLCTAALLITVLTPLRDFDIDSYALLLAKYKEEEAALTARGEEINERLNRLVIEQEYEAYIMDKALELGLEGLAVDVEVQWSLEGLWMPYGASISGVCSQTGKEQLSALMAADLGIPYERQRWDSE